MQCHRYVMRRRDTVSMSESCSETGLNCSINPPGGGGQTLGNAAANSGGCNADEDLLQVRLFIITFFTLKDEKVVRFF